MQKLPKFKLFDEEPSGHQMGAFEPFEPEEEIIELFEQADDLYIEYELEKAEKLLNRIIEQAPAFPEAYFLLTDIIMESGNSVEAEKIVDKAVKLYRSAIPSGYDGEIPWGFTENRHFLTLMADKFHLQKLNENIEGAIETGEQLLSWNLTDNQGIRWMMGDLHLLNENLKEAARYLKQCCNQYPPCRYSFALLLYKQNKKWDAITQFRFGFLENIYISEMLLFNAPVIPYDIDDFNNLNGIDTAGQYAAEMGYYWAQNSDALNFMEVLKKIPEVIKELNDVYSILNELAHVIPDYPFDEMEDKTEQNGGLTNSDEVYLEIRKELVDQIEKIKKEINTTSSKKILKELNEFFGDI